MEREESTVKAKMAKESAGKGKETREGLEESAERARESAERGHETRDGLEESAARAKMAEGSAGKSKETRVELEGSAERGEITKIPPEMTEMPERQNRLGEMVEDIPEMTPPLPPPGPRGRNRSRVQGRGMPSEGQMSQEGHDAFEIPETDFTQGLLDPPLAMDVGDVRAWGEVARGERRWGEYEGSPIEHPPRVWYPEYPPRMGLRFDDGSQVDTALAWEEIRQGLERVFEAGQDPHPLLRELLEIKAYANPANRVYLEVEEDPYGEPPSIHRYVPQHIQVLADPPLDVVGLNGNILAMRVLASVYGLGLGPEGWFWIDDEYFRPEFITSDQLRPRHFGDHPTYGSSMMRRGDSDDERDDDGSDEIRVEDYRVDDEVWGGMDAWAAYPPGVDDPFDGNMNEFEGEAGTPAPPRMESMSDNEENLIGNLEEKKVRRIPERWNHHHRPILWVKIAM